MEVVKLKELTERAELRLMFDGGLDANESFAIGYGLGCVSKAENGELLTQSETVIVRLVNMVLGDPKTKPTKRDT
jgi:hypothetical protein